VGCSAPARGNEYELQCSILSGVHAMPFFSERKGLVVWPLLTENYISGNLRSRRQRSISPTN
jgi:hypothetical protein